MRKFLTKIIILLLVLFVSGCMHHPYRQNLPTTQQSSHTEIITHPDGTVTKKEIIDQTVTNEPAEKYRGWGYGRRGYNVPYYGGGGYPMGGIGFSFSFGGNKHDHNRHHH